MGVLTASLLLLAHLAFTPSVFAQQTNATCNAEYRWMFNSMHQSPCVMASYLRAVCDGNYFLRALPEGYVYTGPQDPEFANPCWCSSVTFSLYQACSLCQSQPSLQRWGDWTTNCTGPNAPSNAFFPRDIPVGTAIPAWAYARYPPAATFSVQVVQEFMQTNQTEFTAPTAHSTSSHRPSGTAVTSKPSSGSSSNAGAIAGGVVGGVFGLALIAGLVYFLLQRRNKLGKAPSHQQYVKASNGSDNMAPYVPPGTPGPVPIIAAPTPRYPQTPLAVQRDQAMTPPAPASPQPMMMTPQPMMTPKPNNAKQVYMPRPGSAGVHIPGHPYRAEV